MQNRIEGYYDYFPPKNMNVSVTQATVDVGNSQSMRKNILVVNKDVEEGEEIYLEEPVVAVLDSDLESSGSHCSYCLRKIDSAISLRIPDDPLRTVYCSKSCQANARQESHNILFGMDPPLPNDSSQVPVPEIDLQARKQAQESLVAILRSSGHVAPLLVARFIARQVAIEIAKIGLGPKGAAQESGSALSDGYSISDHVERLRYLELPTQEEESNLIAKVLETAMPQLAQFVQEERYTLLKGKMAYNAIGVCYAGGRGDKPTPKDREEDREKTRTPYGTDRQIGCGLYPVSSYISHSCRPSARSSFPEGTSSLHLIANRSLKKGDELTMAYVDVSQRPTETTGESRRRRRKELARGWRFPCMCPRCVEEGPQSDTSEDKTSDESKVETVYTKYEDNKTGNPEEL